MHNVNAALIAISQPQPTFMKTVCKENHRSRLYQRLCEYQGNKRNFAVIASRIMKEVSMNSTPDVFGENAQGVQGGID